MGDRNLLWGRPPLEVVDIPSAGPHRLSRCYFLLGIATEVFSLVPLVVSRGSRCVVPCSWGWQCRLQPLICAGHSIVDVNGQAANDESAKTAGGSIGILACLWNRCCDAGKLREISGANVTVSRTHTGFSLCFQIIRTFNRFEVKQGGALFSDTYGKQKHSCPPKFTITGV